MKDPAFLMYSKDFVTGTLHMSPCEIGVYTRLLMHQHQHGSVPNDKTRMMRIAGVLDLEEWYLLWQMVEQKFEQVGDRLINRRLELEMGKREAKQPKKDAAACLGGLLSHSKDLTPEQKSEIRELFDIESFIEETDKKTMLKKIRKWFREMVEQMLDKKGNVIVNVNESKTEKGGVGEKSTPSLLSTVRANGADVQKLGAFGQIRIDLEQRGEIIGDDEAGHIRRLVKRITAYIAQRDSINQSQVSVDRIMQLYQRMVDSDHWQVTNNWSVATLSNKCTMILKHCENSKPTSPRKQKYKSAI